jgi:hypothetical protein
MRFSGKFCDENCYEIKTAKPDGYLENGIGFLFDWKQAENQ